MDAKRVLSRLERLKVDSVAGEQARGTISDLRSLQASQEITIGNLRSQVSTEQLRAYALSSEITGLKREVKRQKRNKVFAIIGGLLASGGLTYLFITK